MRTISNKGIEFIARLEGMRRRVYSDEGGLATIGIGHLLTQAELASGTIIIGSHEIPFGQGLTIDQCSELLKQDLVASAATVARAVTAGINQNQFDAMVSFVFNVGCSAFNRSTLLQCINADELKEVPGQLRKWIYVKGGISDGLRRRREAEIVLWNSNAEEQSGVASMLKAGRIDLPERRKPWYAKLFSLVRFR